ncbi:hypothetical protein GPL15_17635 [Clostridium sp. MCC353]|uniref:hypothetical protein n=1 Tax=Clostridium sp. MCC353 TaxID=2592646 RepID=UPI001C00FDB1|nr:hypothetical protein [Clostridium sp. MCC353]MBT9778321.1 hypothetical protein [Clostridium sp. MCC353]
MKRVKLFLSVVIMSLLMAITAFAGQWQLDSNGWWYLNDDGSYPAGQWQEIDGKHYYFRSDGYMLSNTITPDGYVVGADGAWISGYVLASGYEADEEKGEDTDYDVSIQMPRYKDYTIFNPDRSDAKHITMSCNKGCKMYFTKGYDPDNPTEDDKLYQNTRNTTFNIWYGNPVLNPGETLKVVAIRDEDGARSGVTTLRYEDAHPGNKNRTGDIAASSNPDTSSSNTSGSGDSGAGGGSKTGPITCPVCVGRGKVTCTYCHGSGIGQKASIGLNGDVWQGVCPGCGGSGNKICSGCGGRGLIGY